VADLTLDEEMLHEVNLMAHRRAGDIVLLIPTVEFPKLVGQQSINTLLLG
jgi:hypothetical protein